MVLTYPLAMIQKKLKQNKITYEKNVFKKKRNYFAVYKLANAIINI